MSYRILIVEDERFVLDFVCSALTRCGHEVLAAGSVPEARRLLAGADDPRPLCLLVDVVLHDESGIAFAHEVVRGDPSCRVVLMSGFTDDVLLGEPELSERVAFLRKPFTKDELVAAVDSACAAEDRR